MTEEEKYEQHKKEIERAKLEAELDDKWKSSLS